MPRPPANRKLGLLLKEARLCLHDLAAVSGCSRQRLLDYSLGAKLPRLESRVARCAGITVAELRYLLGLKGGKHVAHSPELFDIAAAHLRRYNRSVAIYRWRNGVGRWVNCGSRFAGHPQIQQLVAIVQRVPIGAIMRNRRGEFWAERHVYLRKAHG